MNGLVQGGRQWFYRKPLKGLDQSVRKAVKSVSVTSADVRSRWFKKEMKSAMARSK